VAVAFGVDADRTETIHICTPQIRIGGGTQLRERYGIGGPLILFLGARRPYKGHDLLLSAADTVASAVPGTAFAFVGPGAPLAPKPLRARVIDAGAVDDVERDDWIDAADLLCLPSRHETASMAFLEAWSAKTPVISSDIPPLAEHLQISGGGWTVRREASALAESLIAALRDPDERDRRGRAGYEFWLAGHTPDVAAARHERLYTALLA
jgi:glycosyltransferase involved in cell wall biosynthesis